MSVCVCGMFSCFLDCARCFSESAELASLVRRFGILENSVDSTCCGFPNLLSQPKYSESPNLVLVFPKRGFPNKLHIYVGCGFESRTTSMVTLPK